MADSFEYKKISNKQNNNQLYFSDQEEAKQKPENAAKVTGDTRQGDEEKQLQGNYEHFERFSEFDEGEFQPQYNFVEGPRQKEKRRKFVLQVDKKDIMPKCGCRDAPYSNNKMLYMHISKQHEGVAPPGTIIGHHKARNEKKPNNDKRARIQIHEALMGQGNYASNNKQEFIDGSEYSQNYNNSHQGSEESEQGYSNQQQASNRKLLKEQSKGKRQPREQRICGICGLAYLSKWAYNLHFIVKHPNQKLEDIPLSIANKSLKSEDKKRPFKCECGKAYTQNSSLLLHIREKHNGYYIKELQQFIEPSDFMEPAQEENQSKSEMGKETEERPDAHKLAGKGKDSEQFNFSSSDQYQEDSQQNTAGGNKLEMVKKLRMEELKAVQNYKSKPQNNDNNECGCGKSYSCRSALNLHIRRRHSNIAPEGTIKGSTYVPTPQQTNIYLPRYSRQTKQKKPNQEAQQKVFRCGCSLTYSCSSALGLHIRKKHEGLAPIGTIGCPASTPSGDYHYISPPKPPKIPITENNECGCGRTYKSSCALRLHVKKHHKGIFPSGEIGSGKDTPRADQTQVDVACSICGTRELGSHFKCLTCASHRICSKCFWGGSYFSAEHEWVRKAEGE